MIKKVLLFFVITIWSFLLCSCFKGVDDLNINVSDSNRSLNELASITYEEPQLSEISGFGGSLNEFDSKYKIECLRHTEGIYRASYLGERSVAVIIFDKQGNKLSGNIHSIHLPKSDFDSLIIGDLLEDVQAIDPNGEYLFLYSGRSDTPKLSSHYTKDGYIITIEYDDSNTIVGIKYELI